MKGKTKCKKLGVDFNFLRMLSLLKIIPSVKLNINEKSKFRMRIHQQSADNLRFEWKKTLNLARIYKFANWKGVKKNKKNGCD